MSFGAEGIERLDQGAPSGAVMGISGSDLIGFHGANPTTQGLTGTYLGTTGVAGSSVIAPVTAATGATGIAGAINCVIQLLRDKGLERPF